MQRSAQGHERPGAVLSVSASEPSSQATDASTQAEFAQMSTGVSPYATGGGGVTLERMVAVRYLALMLTGETAVELGDGRSVVSVAFQQAPGWPVDDLVVEAARLDESEPSLTLMLALRRQPKFVTSDRATRKLMRQFVEAAGECSGGTDELRWGLVVAGPQTHAVELRDLAAHARTQSDARGFFELIQTPGKFQSKLRSRLTHIRNLVALALGDLNASGVDESLVRQRAWEMLAGLEVLTPRFESPDGADWAEVLNRLVGVARSPDLGSAVQLRDRLMTLAAEYAPNAARVDRTMLSRAAHDLLDPMRRRNENCWERLRGIDRRARDSVRDRIESGFRQLQIDRNAKTAELAAAIDGARAVVVCGESGTGKSALAVRSLISAVDPETTDALCVNLRQLPALAVEFEAAIGCSLSVLLAEMTAPERVLVIDGADAIAEGMHDVLDYLIGAADEADVAVVAVAANETKQLVHDVLHQRHGAAAAEVVVASLSDSEIDSAAEEFSELSGLAADPRSRELLRRPVVVDLLVRGGIEGVPLSEADAMLQVWSGLVRRRGQSDRGHPADREHALLLLADFEMCGGDPLETQGQLNATAVAGLHRDGLLTSPDEHSFAICPAFAHDELRRYAVARLMLADGDITSRLHASNAPRWALGAARLAAQATLAVDDLPDSPLRGRFARLQAAFDSLVDAGHGSRWGDVPGEALLSLPEPHEVLADAWPGLMGQGGAELRRVARLVRQRLRRGQVFVPTGSIEPIIERLLEEVAPWRLGEHAHDLLSEWLMGLLIAGTPAGHVLRTELRKLLVTECAAADHRLRERQQATKALSQPPVGDDDLRRAELLVMGNRAQRERRRRPEVPPEITDEIVMELFSLLGPDLGTDGEEILRRIARDAPDSLVPCLEQPAGSLGLSQYRNGLLADLTEAYYLDDEQDGTGHWDFMDGGIRPHQPQSTFSFVLCGPHLGPFRALFGSDFRSGVSVLNRMLNHAARVDARMRSRAHDPAIGASGDEPEELRETLGITGEDRHYIGDDQVWRWYRGALAAAGPYPCMSALQALELVCDQLIEMGIPVESVVSILLEECENLAMVGVVVALLVRHLESTEDLLDRFLVEPTVWSNEFARLAAEMGDPEAASDELVNPERRSWSMREAATLLVLRAGGDRVNELRLLGDQLVENARHQLEAEFAQDATSDGPAVGELVENALVTIRGWASALNRDLFTFQEAPEGIRIGLDLEPDIAELQEQSQEQFERSAEDARLRNRYDYQIRLGNCTRHSIPRQDLIADLRAAEQLLENPLPQTSLSPLDTPALVAATALEAHLIRNEELPAEAITFALHTILDAARDETRSVPHESEFTYFEHGADRSAARSLPLLLTPQASTLRASIDAPDASQVEERIVEDAMRLARTVSYEVRLHLARGLDHLWDSPCAAHGNCHHEAGWRLATETLRDCAVGRRTRDTSRPEITSLDDPLAQTVAELDGNTIRFTRLDAAIRSLAAAAVADICISQRARQLLDVLLAAHRRALLSFERGTVDDRGTHALIAARALLALAGRGDTTPLFRHFDAYLDRPSLLDKLLRALAAAGEETEEAAATAEQIWPSIIQHGIAAHAAGHDLTGRAMFGESTLDALIPIPTHQATYLYREVHEQTIRWWKPHELRAQVRALLNTHASGNAFANRLILFLDSLETQDQARLGLPWMAEIVNNNAEAAARYNAGLPSWLIEIRSAAVSEGLEPTWQETVDALVVAGITELAPYSV